MHLVSIVICSIAGYSPAAYDFLDEKRRLFLPRSICLCCYSIFFSPFIISSSLPRLPVITLSCSAWKKLEKSTWNSNMFEVISSVECVVVGLHFLWVVFHTPWVVGWVQRFRRGKCKMWKSRRRSREGEEESFLSNIVECWARSLASSAYLHCVF